MDRNVHIKESVIKQIRQSFLSNMLTVLFAENGFMLSSKKKPKTCIIVVNYAGIYFYRSKGIRHLPELKAEFSIYDISQITYVDQKTREIKSHAHSVTYTSDHVDDSIMQIVFSRSLLLKKYSPDYKEIKLEKFPRPLDFIFDKQEENMNLTVLRYVCLSVRSHIEPSPDIIKLYKRIKSSPNQTLTYDETLDIPCDIHSIADPITIVRNITTICFKGFVPYGVCRLAHYILKHSNSIRTLIFDGYHSLLPLQLELEKLKGIDTPLSFVFNNLSINNSQLQYLIEELNKYPGEFQRISFNRMTISGYLLQVLFDNINNSRSMRTIEFFEMNQIEIKSSSANDKFINEVQTLLKHCRFLNYVSFSNWPEPIPISLQIFLQHNILSDLALCKQDMTQPLPRDFRFPPHIHHLDFSNCSFTYQSLSSLFSIISHHETPLSLYLSNIVLQESHWRSFFDSLTTFSAMKCLYELDWSGNIIDYQCFQHFSKYFVEETSLRYLLIDRIFGSSQIDDLKSLITTFPKNKIWGLSVGGDCQKNFSGNFKLFLESIEELMPLYFLNINGQQMSEEDADILISFLKRNPQVVDISCDNSQISCEHNFFIFYEDLFKTNIKSIGRPTNDVKRIFKPNMSNLAKPERWSDFRSKMIKHHSSATRQQRSTFLCRINLQDTLNLDQYFEFVATYPKAYFEMNDIDTFNLCYNSPIGVMSSIYQISNKESFTSLQKLHNEMLQSPFHPSDERGPGLKHYGSVIKFETFTNPVIEGEVPLFISEAASEQNSSENIISNAGVKSISTSPFLASVDEPAFHTVQPQRPKSRPTDPSQSMFINPDEQISRNSSSISQSGSNAYNGGFQINQGAGSSAIQTSLPNIRNSAPHQQLQPNNAGNPAPQSVHINKRKSIPGLPSSISYQPPQQLNSSSSNSAFQTIQPNKRRNTLGYASHFPSQQQQQLNSSSGNSAFKASQPSDRNTGASQTQQPFNASAGIETSNSPFQPLQPTIASAGSGGLQPLQPTDANNAAFQPLQPLQTLNASTNSGGLQPLQTLNASTNSGGLQPLQTLNASTNSGGLQPLQPTDANNSAFQPLQPLEQLNASAGSGGLQPLQPIDTNNSALQPIQPLQPLNASDGMSGLQPLQPIDTNNSALQPQQPLNTSSGSGGLQPLQPIDANNSAFQPLQSLEPLDLSAENGGLQPLQPLNASSGSAALSTLQPVIVDSAILQPLQPLNASAGSGGLQPLQPIDANNASLQPLNASNGMSGLQPVDINSAAFQPLQPIGAGGDLQPLQPLNGNGPLQLLQPIQLPPTDSVLQPVPPSLAVPSLTQQPLMQELQQQQQEEAPQIPPMQEPPQQESPVPAIPQIPAPQIPEPLNQAPPLTPSQNAPQIPQPLLQMPPMSQIPQPLQKAPPPLLPTAPKLLQQMPEPLQKTPPALTPAQQQTQPEPLQQAHLAPAPSSISQQAQEERQEKHEEPKPSSRFGSASGPLNLPFAQASQNSLPSGPAAFKLPGDPKDAVIPQPTDVSSDFGELPRQWKPACDSLEIEDVFVFSKNASSQAPQPLSIVVPDLSAVDAMYEAQQPPFQEFVITNLKSLPPMRHPLQSRVRIPPPKVSLRPIPNEW